MEMMEYYNKQKVIVYNTYQLYRHDKLQDLKNDHQVATEKGFMLGAKLVRGAYMEKERARAEDMGYASPIQPSKEASDRDYDAALRFCFDNYQTISFCCASHNLKSNLLLAQLIHEEKLDKAHPHLNFCQLYGMSDNITFNLSQQGYNAAKYVVYGPVREVVPYLVRRAQENTSVTGEMGRELSLLSKEISRRGI
jgi:proline dehydrogenase